ncbi:MAG: PGF-pre-PGF domain-containing protein [Methanoregula sp.]|nr:PGF-pre-PGF domain-containing protein [Methanoregula sp.]
MVGAVAAVPTYDSVAITGGNEVTLTFNESVYWDTALDNTADLVVVVDGGGRNVAPTPVPIRIQAASATTMVVTYDGAAIATDELVSIQITAAGAAKIQAGSDSSFMAATQTRQVYNTADIAAAGVTAINAPVTGGTPQVFGDLAAGSAEYTVTGLSWSPADDPYLGSKVYVATVTLTSASGYKFPVGGIAVPTANTGTPGAGTTGGGDVPGNTLSFTVTFPATLPADIAAAGVTAFNAPATGGTPQVFGDLAAGSAEYTVTGLSWSPADDPYLGSKVYVATVTLTSASGYKFPVGGIAVPTANTGTPGAGSTAGGDVTGNTLYFDVTFPATGAVVPVAGFTGTPTSGASPLWVTFTDSSTNTPTSWSWNFGDGTISSAQNTAHTFTEGTYTVSLTATNAAGSNTATRTDYITVSAAPPAPAPASSTTSDSFASSSSSGGPVAGTNAPTPSGGTVMLTFDQVTSSTSPGGVYQLQIVPNQNIGGFQMIAQPVSLGDALQVQDREVAGYLQIQTVGMNPNVIDHATIVFELSVSWLADHNLNPADIALMRLVDNQWVELPTQFDHQTGNTYYFSSTTPGFSYFAITARPAGAPVVTVEPVNTVSETDTDVQTFGEPAPTETVGSPASGVAVTTQATPVSSPSDTPAPREPSYVPILIIIVCTVVIAGAFIAWRWRQKQENPLLFEK